MMVVMFLESKFKMVHKRICHTMEHGTGSRLGDGFEWVRMLIVNWSSISQQIMKSLSNQGYDPHDCGIRELLTFDDLLKSTFYLHVDAYLEGIFKHTALPPPPRDLSWSPVDPGGDEEEDIPLPREPQPTPGSAVRRRGQQQSTNRMGLSGGKLGGPPTAPEIFLRWSLSDDQEKDYDELISYLEEELGLKMHKARRFDLDCTNQLVEHHPELPDQNLSAQAQIDSDTINEAPQALVLRLAAVQ